MVVLQNAYGVEDGYVPSYERESFKKCFTGKRLREAIPNNVEISIINSSPKIGEKSNSYFSPDIEYVTKKIENINPDVILFCGKNGKTLMEKINFENSVFMPHPAYRALSKEITKKTKEQIEHIIKEL